MTVLKKAEKYFGKHPWFNSTIHIIAGMGVGILITYPIVGDHPVRWGLTLLAIGILGHLAPFTKN